MTSCFFPLIDFEVSDFFRDYGNRSEKSGVRDKRVLPVLEPDRLYLELAFLMMFSWICDHSLSVLHLRYINDVFEKLSKKALTLKDQLLVTVEKGFPFQI